MTNYLLAHSDPSITTINFLQFSDEEWSRYAGNRYMFHNRLRMDDYAAVFEETGLDVRLLSGKVDLRALEELRSGFVLDDRFRDKSPETNATGMVRIVAGVVTPPPVGGSASAT